MTAAAVLRLLTGLLAVLLAVAALTVHLDRSQAQVASREASIKTLTYDVGTSYAGLVVEQPVAVGDHVAAGDPLVVIDSAALRQDVAHGLVDPDTSAATIDASGLLTVTATGDGIVADLRSTTGTFVQAGTVLATVERTGTLYVSAQYELTPEQYARLEDSAEVALALPDGTRLTGTVGDVSVQSTGGAAQAVATVTSAGLVRGAADGLVAPGTPVTATLHLRRDGVVSTMADRLTVAVDSLLDRWPG
ncbi:HlyD family efflux transporter periplasmic adaptor subunit [Cellulomonas soli]|uniref:HlyD family efflux transporter periplasmic adaptor subunit n=1 Tax=Cellulomonas soli TaxID=931535 RepID=UPI003F838B09